MLLCTMSSPCLAGPLTDATASRDHVSCDHERAGGAPADRAGSLAGRNEDEGGGGAAAQRDARRRSATAGPCIHRGATPACGPAAG